MYTWSPNLYTCCCYGRPDAIHTAKRKLARLRRDIKRKSYEKDGFNHVFVGRDAYLFCPGDRLGKWRRPDWIRFRFDRRSDRQFGFLSRQFRFSSDTGSGSESKSKKKKKGSSDSGSGSGSTGSGSTGSGSGSTGSGAGTPYYSSRTLTSSKTGTRSGDRWPVPLLRPFSDPLLHFPPSFL